MAPLFFFIYQEGFLYLIAGSNLHAHVFIKRPDAGTYGLLEIQ